MPSRGSAEPLFSPTTTILNYLSAEIVLWRSENAAKNVAEALARQSKFALCRNFSSLASTGFLEHLKTPTDGALSTKCLPSPCH